MKRVKKKPSGGDVLKQTRENEITAVQMNTGAFQMHI
jgi:hypothetical protein